MARRRPSGAASVSGPGHLRARDVFAQAFSIYMRRFRVVAAVGAAVFAPLALLEAAAGHAIHAALDDGGSRRLGAIAVWLSVALLMFGSALCAGFLDRLVGHEFGREEVTFRVAARTLPYPRLIGIDVAQAIAVGIGALAGFVPGVIVLTLTCLAGPLVMIEERGVRSSMSRSVALTARRFALPFIVVTVPVGLEHQAMHALEVWIGFPFLVLWALHAVVAVLVLVPAVLCEITVAYDLTGQRFGDNHPETGDGAPPARRVTL